MATYEETKNRLIEQFQSAREKRGSACTLRKFPSEDVISAILKDELGQEYDEIVALSKRLGHNVGEGRIIMMWYSRGIDQYKNHLISNGKPVGEANAIAFTFYEKTLSIVEKIYDAATVLHPEWEKFSAEKRTQTEPMSRAYEIVTTVQDLFKKFSWDAETDYLFSLKSEKSDTDKLSYVAKIIINPDGIITIRITIDRKILNNSECCYIVYSFSSLSCIMTGITNIPQTFSVDDALANIEHIIEQYTTDMDKYKASAS